MGIHVHPSPRPSPPNDVLRVIIASRGGEGVTLAALVGCWIMVGLISAPAFSQSQPVVAVEDSEDLLFTPAGFSQAGVPKWAEGDGTATLEITVRGAQSD